jgi:hypothetical protein
MKSRKTNLEASEADASRPEEHDPAHDPMGKRPQKHEIRLGREAQVRIGELLRSMYNTYANQRVPHHLEDLVRRLGEQD